MTTIILDIDLDFDNLEVYEKGKQHALKTLEAYHAALVKASSVISLLKDNILEDESNDLKIFINEEDKICVKATNDLAERFVCIGIADYDESASDNSSESDYDDESTGSDLDGSYNSSDNSDSE